MVTGSNVRRAREVIAALAPILRPRSLAGSTGSTIDGSSFSGLFTRVELGNLRDRSINDHSCVDASPEADRSSSRSASSHRADSAVSSYRSGLGLHADELRTPSLGQPST